MLKCRKLLYLIPLLLFCVPSARANQNAQGWCESGAQPVVTSGLISSTLVQASFPACTVTVFVHGGGLATIFSDNAGTPLSNPFTAASNGRWIWYAGNGRYDVQLSGAGFPSPVTYSDISLSDPANQQAAVPCSTLSFSATPAFLATNNICYNMTLTGNITSSTITGTPTNGNILLLNFTQDATGGRSFVFPPSFIIPSGTVFSSAPNTTNYLAFKFDGINWSFFTNTGTSSGGSPAVGPLGTLQTSNGTGAFATSGESDDGTTLSVDRDARFKGPNPYVDIVNYGARAVNQNLAPAIPGITANCSNTSANVTLSSASTFQNGDGVAVYGCGPLTANVPAAPTVTPVVAAAQTGTMMAVTGPVGATTYCYQILSRTFLGGTAPSTEACTNTGPASLGLQSISITSVSLANNKATYTTSAPHGLVAGALVVITNIVTSEVNPTINAFNGWFTVASSADNTHFIVNLMYDSRNGAISGGTGGTVNYWNGIQIKGVETTNNYQYYVYGRVTGGTKTLIGAMLPQNHALTLGGFPDPFYLLWDDFGSPVSTFPNPPPYIPTTVPVSSTNDMLATTIVSGAGTTSLTLANAAGNTISGSTILQDSGQNFLAAAIAAKATGGWVRIPATNGLAFVFNTPIAIPTGSGLETIVQESPIFINEPIKFSQTAKWKQGIAPSVLGAQNPGFSPQVATTIFCNKASPCIYALTNFHIEGIAFNQQSANGTVMYLQDGGGIPSMGKYDNVSWIGFTGGPGYYNIPAIWRGNGSGLIFLNPTVTGGQNNSLVAVTPGMFFDQPGNIKFDSLTESGVGIALYPNLQGAGAFYSTNGTYMQGGYMPKFSIMNNVGPVWFTVNTDINDTPFNSPTIANYGGSNLMINGFMGPGLTGIGGSSSGGSIGDQVNVLSTNGSYFQGNAFGQGITGLTQKTNTSVPVLDGTFGNINMANDFINRSQGIGQGYSYYTLTASPPAPTCSASAGGTLNTGTYQVFYSPVFFGNGSTGQSSLSCTVTLTPGNQTINASVITPIAGSNTLYDWAIVRGVGGSSECGVTGLSLTVSADATGFPCGSIGLGGGPKNPSGGPAGIHGNTSWSQNQVLGLTTLTSNATVPRAITWPNAAGTPALLGLAQTWTTPQTFSNGTELRFLSNDLAHYAGFKGGASVANLIWLFPTTDSTGTQCLSSNGSLQLAWSTCSAGTGTPGGANTQVQFNNSGSFGGSANLTWVSPKLTIGVVGATTGQLALSGATSGTITITPQTIAGSPTLTLPNTTGTFASNATAPITLDAAAGTIACATCVTSAAALTANQLVIGGGLQASATLGTLGTTTTVLHGNAGGAPTFAAVNLATETTGITAIANGGTGQATQTLAFDALSPTTTRGDIIVRGASNNVRLALGPNGNCLTSNGTDAAWGSCAAGAIGGSGVASQVAFFSSPTAITGNANWTYASATGQTLTQGANAVDAFIMSRFTDTAPTGNFLNLKTAGGTTVFKVDVNGNATGTSFTGGGAGPSYLDLPQTSAPPFGTNSIRIFAPTSVPTSYAITLPGASATGFIRATNSSNVNTWTFVAASGTGACASTVVTAVNDNAAPTCNPVTGSMFGSQAQNLVFASPSGSAGNPTFRLLVSADLPAINLNVGGGGGVTGTLPIANGGTNATTALTAFNNLSPLTTAGDTLYGGASGSGTRLAAGTSSQLLHSGTTPSWSAVSLTAEVSGILPIANGGTNASSGLTNTNGAVYSDGTKLVSTATGGAGTLCLVSVSGGTPAFGSCAGSSSTVWSSLTNPVADLSLAMGVNNSLFTSGVLTGTRNAWEFVDGNSTSTGSLMSFHTGTTSTMKPFTSTAQGTANGVQMDTTGNLGVIGTGHITADKLSRTLTTTSPLTIGGGASADLTADRTLACATCVTSGSALTTNAIVLGSGGGQGVASLANGAAGTILTGGTPPSYIDLPDVKTVLAAVCINGTAAPGWSTTATTPTATCRAGTNNKDAYLLWGASDVAYAKLHLPADWDSGTNPYLSMDMASTDATNGHTIIMQVATICAKGDGTTTDDVAFNTAQSLSTITLNGNANRSWTATLNNFTMTGCAANGILFLKFSRTTDTATNVEIYQATVTIPRKIIVQAN